MGFFSKIAEGLRKTKNKIADGFKKLFGMGISDAFYDELYDILISSDVGAKASDEICKKLKDNVSDKRINDTESVKEELRSILIEMLDFEPFEPERPCIFLIAGVNGVGKTTSIGKLANYYRKKGKSVTVAAADTFRAAAADQLEIWANRAGVKLIRQNEGADPSSVVYDAIASVRSKNCDMLIIDTAGRLHNKSNLMSELEKINRVCDREYPEAVRYNFIVLDATTGQNAIAQVNAFDEAIEIDGIILTKLDGSAKGGVVLAINSETPCPVVYVGVGEKVDDLEMFNAKEFVNGIL